MQRVLIIGPCGAGKSTLARQLGERLALPIFHIDQLNWRPGWVETEKSALRARLDSIVAGDRWLIDGNYGGTLDARLNHADTIIYLDFPIRLCLWRLAKRVYTHHGRARPDMPQGCPERFDPGFFWYVARWNHGPRPRTEAKLLGQEGKLIRLRSPAELARWMDSLGLAA